MQNEQVAESIPQGITSAVNRLFENTMDEYKTSITRCNELGLAPTVIDEKKLGPTGTAYQAALTIRQLLGAIRDNAAIVYSHLTN